MRRVQGVQTIYNARAMRVVPEAMVAEDSFVAVAATSYAQLNNVRIYSISTVSCLE